jgi:membrane protease YdiL (CAAX protease family)
MIEMDDHDLCETAQTVDSSAPTLVTEQKSPALRGRSAIACYFAVVIGVLLVSLVTVAALSSTGINLRDPPYPLSLISIPVNEITIFFLTLVFARRSRASFSQLGFKRVSASMFVKMILLAVLMLILTSTVALAQSMIFGTDPAEQVFSRLVVPRTGIQLIALGAFSMLLVGPIEELFARGYIQQGLEGSLGKMKGWLLASFLFGMLHALNIVRAIAPTFVAGLFLGYIWQRTDRNTTAVAIVHGAYDSIALALALLAGS